MASPGKPTTPVALALVRFPNSKDGGMLDFQFIQPDLNEAAKQQASATLEFDTAKKLDGYFVRDFGNGFIGLRMTTYALGNIFEAFEGATSVSVQTSVGSGTIDLSGLSEVLPSLKRCVAG